MLYSKFRFYDRIPFAFSRYRILVKRKKLNREDKLKMQYIHPFTQEHAEVGDKANCTLVDALEICLLHQ